MNRNEATDLKKGLYICKTIDGGHCKLKIIKTLDFFKYLKYIINIFYIVENISINKKNYCMLSVFNIS